VRTALGVARVAKSRWTLPDVSQDAIDERVAESNGSVSFLSRGPLTTHTRLLITTASGTRCRCPLVAVDALNALCSTQHTPAHDEHDGPARLAEHDALSGASQRARGVGRPPLARR
jgi:hypothetical protein